MNVPKIRFNNFSDEYEIKEVGDITISVSSGKISKQLVDGEYNVYGSMGIIGSSNFYDYDGEKVLVARVGANAGSVNKINEKCCISDNTLVLEPKNVFNDYLFYSLSHYNPKKLIFGSGQPLVTGGQLKKITIGIPDKEEQIKVSNFLSLLDKKMELQTKKIEDLKLFKLCISNAIFNYKNEEQNTISDFCKIVTSTSKSQYIDNNGKYFIMDMGTIDSNGNIIHSKKTNLEKDILTLGDLIMPKDDIGGGLIIGKNAYIPENNKYILGDHVYCLKTFNINSLYFHYLINSNYINKNLKKKVTGSAQLGLNSKSVLEQKIFVHNDDMQQKISNLLLSIDKKIQIEISKIELIEKLKKGLMQNMFV